MPLLKRIDEDNSLRTPTPSLGTVTRRPRRLCLVVLAARIGISAASCISKPGVPESDSVGLRVPRLLRLGCLSSLVQCSVSSSPAIRLLKIPEVVRFMVRLLSCLVGRLLFSCGILRSAWDAIFVMLPRLLDASTGGCLGATLPFASSCSSHFFTSSIAAAMSESQRSAVLPCESLLSARCFFPYDRRRATFDANFATFPRLRAVS